MSENDPARHCLQPVAPQYLAYNPASHLVQLLAPVRTVHESDESDNEYEENNSPVSELKEPARQREQDVAPA